jgi:hypothetical protein
MEGQAEPDAEAVGQRRCEVLAALCLAVTAAVMLRGYAVAGAVSQVFQDGLGGPTTWQLIELGAGASTFYPVSAEGVTALATLVLAYLLVVEIGPGTWVGAVGGWVLQGLVAVGSLLVLGGAIATGAALRQPGQIEGFVAPTRFEGQAEADTLTKVLERGGTALPIVAGAAVAGFVVWLAWRAMVELRQEPGPAAADAGEPDPDGDPDGDLDPYGADADPSA